MKWLRKMLRRLIGCEECKNPCAQKVSLVLDGKVIAIIPARIAASDYFDALESCQGRAEKS